MLLLKLFFMAWTGLSLHHVELLAPGARGERNAAITRELVILDAILVFGANSRMVRWCKPRDQFAGAIRLAFVVVVTVNSVSIMNASSCVFGS